MMKQIFALAALSAALFSAAPAQAEDLYTGDTKLACEAILCLSASAGRPAECAPSINKYFSLKFKYMSDTLKARRGFLHLCPTSSEPHMPEYINTLVNGGGRCDAAELNSMNKVTTKSTTYKKVRYGHEVDYEPVETTQTYIKNSKPAYCTEFSGNKTEYVGTEQNGGHWVDR